MTIEDDVLGFDVPVHDHFGVEVVQGHEDGGNHELGLSFSEEGHFGEVVPQISSFHEIHDDVQVVVVLEGIHHVDDELVPESCQELSFVEDRVDTPLGYDSTVRLFLHGLRHFFHCIDTPRSSVLHFPHLTETSLPDHVQVLVSLLSKEKTLRVLTSLFLSLSFHLLYTLPFDLVPTSAFVLLQRFHLLR